MRRALGAIRFGGRKLEEGANAFGMPVISVNLSIASWSGSTLWMSRSVSLVPGAMLAKWSRLSSSVPCGFMLLKFSGSLSRSFKRVPAGAMDV